MNPSGWSLTGPSAFFSITAGRGGRSVSWFIWFLPPHLCWSNYRNDTFWPRDELCILSWRLSGCIMPGPAAKVGLTLAFTHLTLIPECSTACEDWLEFLLEASGYASWSSSSNILLRGVAYLTSSTGWWGRDGSIRRGQAHHQSVHNPILFK